MGRTGLHGEGRGWEWLCRGDPPHREAAARGRVRVGGWGRATRARAEDVSGVRESRAGGVTVGKSDLRAGTGAPRNEGQRWRFEPPLKFEGSSRGPAGPCFSSQALKFGFDGSSRALLELL